MITQPLTMDKLADALIGAAPDLDPAGQRLFIATYRLLAAGHPVTSAELARAAGLPEPPVADALGRWPGVFTDRQGRVTGFWGLAIGELSPAHRFESGGQVLYAWCAWDTLFLPARLGQDARVISYALCRLALDRRRLSAWESAWALIGPRWTTRR
jgi:alkylmercury lyase